jgi:hypothetical protein
MYYTDIERPTSKCQLPDTSWVCISECLSTASKFRSYIPERPAEETSAKEEEGQHTAQYIQRTKTTSYKLELVQL